MLGPALVERMVLGNYLLELGNCELGLGMQQALDKQLELDSCYCLLELLADSIYSGSSCYQFFCLNFNAIKLH